MKRYLALILSVVMLAGLLYGCGGASKEANMAGNGGAAMDKAQMEFSTEMEPGDAGLTSSSTSITNAPETPMNQKLVRKVWINAETDDLDALLSQIDEKLATLSGYAENREVYNGNSKNTRRRNATMTLRIPVAQLDQFISHVTELSNITSSTETADDITLTYIATESRVKALQTEHDRLLALLEKAENMKDLLEIEKRLTQVRGDLEEVASKLKLYDNMVDYATVHLNLNEVKEYTDVTEPETVWQRIGKGFMESLTDLADFFTELFVFIVVGIPYFVILAIMIVVIVLILKRRSKKNKRDRKPIQTEFNKE